MPPRDPALEIAQETAINGAFQIDLTARFDDPISGSWQRLFDFGSGPGSDNILLTQYENTNDLSLVLYQDGTRYEVTASEAIVAGETADFSAGIDDAGVMWIAKDGVVLAEADGVVPADVDRANALIGRSNWPGDAPQPEQRRPWKSTQSRPCPSQKQGP